MILLNKNIIFVKIYIYFYLIPKFENTLLTIQKNIV